MVEDSTIATLKDLETFTEYCVLLIIQFENEDGTKTVPSDRLGPKCLRTPAGGRLNINFATNDNINLGRH